MQEIDLLDKMFIIFTKGACAMRESRDGGTFLFFSPSCFSRSALVTHASQLITHHDQTWPSILSNFVPLNMLNCLCFFWITVSDCQKTNTAAKRHFIVCHLTNYSMFLRVFWHGFVQEIPRPPTILKAKKTLATRLKEMTHTWTGLKTADWLKDMT